MNRRQFLQTGSFFTVASYRRILGANSRMRVGFIGMGTMGWHGNMPSFLRQNNVEVSGVCDVYGPHLERAREKAVQHSSKLLVTSDFREIVNDKDTDAVCISTPDHWHAPMTVMALKARKHVYCEKPIAHNPFEVEIILKAWEKYRMVYQSGQWQQSANQFLEAAEYVQSGQLGKIRAVNTWLQQNAGNMGKPEDSEPPGNLNWDMWLGPAPLRPFNANRFLFNWRWFWDYGSGMFGDWNPHLFSVGYWGASHQISDNPMVIIVTPVDECTRDNRETPTKFALGYHFLGRTDNFAIFSEYDGCREQENKRSHGIEWVGENGSVFVNREFCEIKDPQGRTIREIPARGEPVVSHWQNFIEAIRNNNLDTRAGLANIGLTNLYCLLGATVYRWHRETQKTALLWDPISREPLDKDTSRQIQKYYQRDYRAPWKLET